MIMSTVGHNGDKCTQDQRCECNCWACDMYCCSKEETQMTTRTVTFPVNEDPEPVFIVVSKNTSGNGLWEWGVWDKDPDSSFDADLLAYEDPTYDHRDKAKAAAERAADTLAAALRYHYTPNPRAGL